MAAPLASAQPTGFNAVPVPSSREVSGDQSWTGEEILNYLPGTTWSMDALIPDRDKDPIEPGHHFKTPEGWTIGSHPDMTVTDRQHVHTLILNHKSAFAYALSDLSGYTGPEPEFMLGAPGESVVLPPGNHIHPPRSRSPLEEQVIDEHMTPLRDAGFIERAKFALKSHEPVVAAKKNPETGEWTDKRCCVNYGEGCGGINKYTKLDPYQLPLPEDLYARTAGCKFFSVIDLKSGFSNTKMHESVRPLAAFWWNRELWVTTRNTFGLKNMPAYFQRVVDRTIRDAGLSNCVCGFIDDLLIFTPDLESHKAAITKLFDALAAVGLKAHPGKSRFCFDTIEYLGHNISSYGLSPNDVKVAAIRALPIPSNVHELRRVLGFINYYRVYCPMFSDTAAPLNQLLKKNTPWKWDVEQDLALNALKEAICKPGNALKHPDRNRRYVLHTDWSKRGMSAILGQVDSDGNEYMIACISRSCNVHETNYGSYKGEMCAAVWGIRSFRKYLLGAKHPFLLLTDHRGLSWLLSNKDQEGQYARWSVLLSEFDFMIEYKPGLKHIIADVPSRFPQSTTLDHTGSRESFATLLSHESNASPVLCDGTQVIEYATSLLAGFPADLQGFCNTPLRSGFGDDFTTAADGIPACYMSLIHNYIHNAVSDQNDSDFLRSHSMDMSNDDDPLSTYVHFSVLQMQTTLSAKAQSQVAHCAPLLSSVPSSTPTTLQFTEDKNGFTYSSINSQPLPSSNVHSAFHGGVTILELFGGMVSGLDCILRNGVHVHRYYYCDKSPSARRVAANRLNELSMRYPHQFPFEAWSTAFTAFPQDVYKITEQHLISAGCMNESQWLFIAGFECVDLSSAGNRTGLQGNKSDTFYPMLNILGMLQSLQHSLPPIYLIENTAVQHARSSSPAMHAAFEELCLRIGTPVVLDAARVNSYAHRLRNYWTNLAPSASLQITLDSYERDSTLFLSDVLDYGHTPQICRSVHGAPYYPANKKDLPLFVLPTLVARHQSYAFSVRDDVIGSGLVLDTAGNLVDLTIQERERILGYPTDCTQADGVSISQRHALTGGCFDAFAVSHLLATAFAIHSVIYDESHSFISLSALAVTSELGGGPDEYDSDDSDYPVVSVHALFTDSAYLLQDAAHSLLADAEDTAHANSSVEVDVWLDDNVLSYLKNSSTDLLDKFNDTERRRVLRRSQFYAWDGSQLFPLGYRMTPHESTKLSPYQMLYACTPVVPPHVMERISGPLNFDDPEIASQSILAKALILQEYCITAGHNLFIAQHRDTLRYAKLHSGGYLPSAHKFSVGQFVYVRNWKVLHKEARPEVLRILDIRPTGVLVLIGRDGVKIVENVVNCSPCHLPIDEIDAPSTALIRPSKNYTCSVCDSPQREDVMLICDSCQLGFHTFCLNPPLSDLPTEDIWICSPCLDAGVTPAVIKAVWSHPQFQADARLHDARVLQRIKPRGRGRPPKAVIPTNPAPSSTQSVLVPPSTLQQTPRRRGRPRKNSVAAVRAHLLSSQVVEPILWTFPSCYIGQDLDFNFCHSKLEVCPAKGVGAVGSASTSGYTPSSAV
ncbi:hypothetical protein CEUSTIGMA_g13886.t1 [Chlamydomonas eustigma]|uniref:PHD-type domain-containing protein n=1 Tax=Chlamydomonas eustigma TaxID=1157962 RepID=A0A250XTT2_9CHLO|nr:hypothetical protein CEUSTIGMA_g13886.t1 [Chlamydomonas eustigma]|eukprot:GAX86477.1 hypothetical protein CEUSTIGMA_g13886.t1 [Chlamydomonas eustigma]